MNKYLVRNFKWRENLGKVPTKVYRLVASTRCCAFNAVVSKQCCAFIDVVANFRAHNAAL